MAMTHPKVSSKTKLLAFLPTCSRPRKVKLNDIDRCRELVDEALKYQGRAVRGQPKNAKYLRILSQQHQLRAVVALRQKDHAQAADSVQKAMTSREKDLRFRQWASRVFVNCIALARADAGLLPAERDELMGEYGARGVAQIRYAVDAGVPAATIQKDPSLRPLHDHSDWKKLFDKKER